MNDLKAWTVAERSMVKLKRLFEINSFENCTRLEVWRNSQIGDIDHHQGLSPGMKLDSYKFEEEIVDEGFTGRSTK